MAIALFTAGAQSIRPNVQLSLVQITVVTAVESLGIHERLDAISILQFLQTTYYLCRNQKEHHTNRLKGHT